MNESHSSKFFLAIWLTCPPYSAGIWKQPILALNSTITSTCQGKIPDSQPCLYPCEMYKCGNVRRQRDPVTGLGSAPASCQPWKKDAWTTFSEPTGWSCNSTAPPNRDQPIQRPKRRQLKYLAQKTTLRKKSAGDYLQRHVSAIRRGEKNKKF